MPVEREFKYVLHDPEKTLFNFLKNRAKWDQKVLTQSYINDNVRLRRIGLDETDQNLKYYFTYKKMVENELIEIETEIDQYDYNKLISIVEPGRTLMKTRFDMFESENVTWSIDYLWDMTNLNVYFVICEFETKYDVRTAPEPIYYIKEYLVHTDDGTYDLTSNALSDVKFAKDVMKSILAP